MKVLKWTICPLNLDQGRTWDWIGKVGIGCETECERGKKSYREKDEREKVGEGRDKNDVRANRSKIDCEKNKLKLQEKRCWEINRQRWEIRREGQRKEDNWKPEKKKKCRHHCKFRPISVCNFKGPVQSYLLLARTGICREEVGESEQAEGRVGSGAWVALVVGALKKKEAEPLLFLSKACSN